MQPGLYDRAVIPLADAEMEVPACPVCDHTRARPVFTVQGLAARLVVCARCGLGRLHPMPDHEEILSFYPDTYYGEPGRKFEGPVERLVRLVGGRHLRFLTQGLRPGARVLDLGCGRGVLLGALADRGLEAHGVEVNAAAARGADPRAHVAITSDLAKVGYPDGHFDQVIVWHVLEHLRDPRATLVEVRRILRPDGRLVVAVPNLASAQARWAGAAWFHLDLPRHLWHFPLTALDALLARTGFRVESEHHFSLRQNPFGWVQSALNMSRRLPRNGLYVLLHRRATGEPAPFASATRLVLRAAYVLAMPLALGLSVLEAAFCTGATVHVVARPAGPRS